MVSELETGDFHLIITLTFKVMIVAVFLRWIIQCLCKQLILMMDYQCENEACMYLCALCVST